jgi:hypothetical protein
MDALSSIVRLAALAIVFVVAGSLPVLAEAATILPVFPVLLLLVALVSGAVYYGVSRAGRLSTPYW